MTALPKFLGGTSWKSAAIEPLAGDASTRCYFRLRAGGQTAVLMDASRARETIPPFIRINEHLQQMEFSTPEILAWDEDEGFLLLEDFGDETFARRLDEGGDPEETYTLATDVLIALHKRPDAVPTVPEELRAYSPAKMLEDLELFPDVYQVAGAARDEFKRLWAEALPLAHRVPSSLLLRDYHVANLMWLRRRYGVRRAGLLDFQDAYRGPVTYDLVSLLEDARRDVPAALKEKMLARYRAQLPSPDRDTFATSLAVVAALRHTRVLAVFEKLAREGKGDYQQSHSPRVRRLLQSALDHPKLAGLKSWFSTHAG